MLVACTSERTRNEGTRARVFSAAGKVLDDIALKEDDGIPDAVLNRTRCLVLVPAGDEQEGMVSCYESLNQWTRPGLVAFEGKRQATNDLLVFVLGEKEAKELLAGRLNIGAPTPTSAGPLVRSKPVVTDAELNFGLLVYERSRDVLAGTVVQGTVAPLGAARPGGSPSRRDEQLQGSLASFFNAITPTGIILHHTAVLPASQEVPADKRDVDAYHLQKGFDVVCFGREYHVAYHFLILEDGKIQAGRPERCQGGHARGYNSYLGISIAGDFSSKDNPSGAKGAVTPTPQQQQALTELCRRLQGRYGIPTHRILRHSDVAPTQCPGDRFPFLKILQAVGR